jgi:hypothetical protein
VSENSFFVASIRVFDKIVRHAFILFNLSRHSVVSTFNRDLQVEVVVGAT